MALPLAVTMGEPAGVGGDILLKAWRRRADGVPSFFAIDNPDRLRALAGRLGLDCPIAEIARADEAGSAFAEAVPVLALDLPAEVAPGRPDSRNVGAVARSIAMAVDLCRAGEVAGLVTNPIHKAVMYQGGFAYPGHTEYLAHLAGLDGREVMMLACPGLRVVPVTIHVALTQAIAQLSSDLIVMVGRETARSLARDFGLARPRLAVAGLNPHAGEDGGMGREEIDIIAPAIAALRADGIDAFGPLPPDTLFHARARQSYDAVLCMYHDQALIPLKTIDFDAGVNITLGLPFVRTSPDHGTAFDLAGTGRAVETSLMAALRTAAEIAANRRRADHG
jgi:4-hydroxythreonine-4-phosphate dehydrogenase